jgi:hypothetical protein
MPEAAVDKDRHAPAGESDIRSWPATSGVEPNVNAEAPAAGVQL